MPANLRSVPKFTVEQVKRFVLQFVDFPQNLHRSCIITTHLSGEVGSSSELRFIFSGSC